MSPEAVARHRVRLTVAFAAVYLIWGSTYLGIAFAIQSIPPLLMASARFLLAGGILYSYARWRGGARPRPVQWGWAFLLGAMFFLIGNGTVVWVEQRLPSGLTALVVAMVSVWTVLIEWFRPGGARPTGVVLAGVTLGFLGVALLVLPGQVGGGHVDSVGVMLLMFSTFAWALASVLSQHADLPTSAAVVSGMEMLAGGVLLLLASVAIGDWGRFDPSGITLKSGLSFLYLVVFGSLVTFTAFAWLLQVSTPNKVATAGYVNPMVAVALGWAFDGEALSPRSLVASLVIIASVVLIITGRELYGRRPVAAAASSSARGSAPSLSRYAGRVDGAE
ncbi:MAG TPA: EamA family transporter [Gemmatimonadales bacterium]|nr:EamA family transporter [Gemmatimonadales bacterium]